MIKKIATSWARLLILVLFCTPIIFSKQRTVKKETTTTVSTQLTAQSAENAIINEIKALLQSGKTPQLSFKDWCTAKVPTLMQSQKPDVKKLAATLTDLQKGNLQNISAFKVLPTFEKAVQAHDPAFKIKMLTKPVIIAKGTYWYFKRSTT